MSERLQRYVRQMTIDGWADDGQEKLSMATVFVAGAGGLGSPVLLYLATAGVGNIVVCDMDVVDISNLNRQILHGDSRLHIDKAVSAKITLHYINPEIQVKIIQEEITRNNVHQLTAEAKIIVDCLDNFAARYLLMEEAIRRDIPLVHGSVWGMEGRVSLFHVPETPCLKCVFPAAPPKEQFPIVGATVGVIGSLQALEVIKFLTQTGDLMKNTLLVWDGSNNSFNKFKIHARKDCPICGYLHKK